VTRISEEIKPVALAISELCLSKGVSQLDCQSVKFCSNLMQRFRGYFWAWLCLTNVAMLSQSKYLTGFWVILGPEIPNLHDPYI